MSSSATLHRLQVVVEGQLKPIKDDMAKLKQLVKSTMGSVDNDIAKSGDGYKEVAEGTSQVSQETESMAQTTSGAMEDMQNEINGFKECLELAATTMKHGFDGTVFRQTAQYVRDYVQEAQIAAGIKVYDDDYLDALEGMEEMESQLESYRLKREELAKSGGFIEQESEAMKTARKGYDDTTKTLEKLIQKQKELKSSGKFDIANKEEYDALKEKMSSAKEELAALTERQKQFNELGIDKKSSNYKSLQSDIKSTKTEITNLQTAMDDLKMPTLQMENVSEQIRDVEEAQRNYKSTMDSLKNSGADTVLKETAAWNRNEDAIRSAKQQMEQYRFTKDAMEQTGTNVKFANTGNMTNASSIQSMVVTVQKAMSDISRAATEAKSRFAETIQGIPGIGKAMSNAAYVGSKAFQGMKAVLGSVGTAIKKASGFFGSLLQRLKNTTWQSGKTGGALKKMGSSAVSAGGGIFKLANMLKMMLTRMVLRSVISGTKEGFDNLVQYSNSANQAISSLKSNLTQLKNSFAAAFAPILEVVVPIINTLISYVVTAINAVGQLFAALTGSSTYTTAKYVQEDYAASLGSATDSANDATAATEAYKKSLMGFDQINKLDDQSSNSGSSGSGGTGSGSGTGNMFETVTVDSAFSNLASKLKEAWNNADFTEIGEIVGKKLNEALASIDWVAIQSTLDQIVKSVATFLNGFISATDWTLVGSTLSEGLNTVFRTANTFATTFNWGSLGNAIGDGINGALGGIDWVSIKTSVNNVVGGIVSSLNSVINTTDWGLVGSSFAECINTIIGGAYTAVTTFDWKGLGSAIASSINGAISTIDWTTTGKTLSDGVRGILDTLKTALAETDWQQLGRSIADFITSIDWGGIIKDLAEVLGLAIGGLALLLWGAIEDCVISIVDYFSKKIEECGGSIILGLLKGILDGMEGIVSWLYDNVVAPIINGITSLFGGGSLADDLWSDFEGDWDKSDKHLAMFAKIENSANNLWGKYEASWGKSRTLDTHVKIANTADNLWGKYEASWGKSRTLDTHVNIANSADNLWGKYEDSWGTSRTLDTYTKIVTSTDALWSELQKGWGTSKTLNTHTKIATSTDTLWSKLKTNWGTTKTLDTNTKIATSADSLWGKFKDSWGTTRTLDTLNKITTTPDTLWGKFKGSWGTTRTLDTLNKITTTPDSLWGKFNGSWGTTRTLNTQNKITTPAKTLWSNFNTDWGKRSVNVTANMGTTAKSLWSTLSSDWGSKKLSLGFKLPSIGVNWGSKTVLGFKISYPSGFYTYAKGGLPDIGEMFIAREAGPELVGRMGNKNSVANNSQIVEGITGGVYKGVMAALSARGSSNRNSTPTFNIFVGGKRITDVVIEEINRRVEAGYTPLKV